MRASIFFILKSRRQAKPMRMMTTDRQASAETIASRIDSRLPRIMPWTSGVMPWILANICASWSLVNGPIMLGMRASSRATPAVRPRLT